MNRLALISTGTLALCLALAGCNSGGGTTPDAGTPPSDSGVTADAGSTSGDAGVCNYPAGPYGTLVGRKFKSFTLPQCDGTPFDFSQDFCSTTLSVVSIGAGWCPHCQDESASLTSVITEPYRSQGVRVIQILMQDAMYNAPTQTFCNNWVSTYGLTNIEVMDPDQISNVYYPAGGLPATLIIDGDGIIQYRQYGAADGLTSIKAKLDQLLAAM